MNTTDIAKAEGLKYSADRILCQQCGEPKKHSHCTPVGPPSKDGLPPGGPCPLCEDCWSALTPEERVPFYRVLYDYHVAYAREFTTEGWLPRDWQSIEEAVLAGL